MHTVLLVIHLVLALSLIGIVLLQRSEGGGLGMGGGGAMTGRAAATALGKVTWFLAIAFLCTSMGLTIIAAKESAGASVLDRLSDAPVAEAPAEPISDAASSDLLPPTPENTDLVPTLD